MKNESDFDPPTKEKMNKMRRHGWSRHKGLPDPGKIRKPVEDFDVTYNKAIDDQRDYYKTQESWWVDPTGAIKHHSEFTL